MKRGHLILFLTFSLKAQQSDERLIGILVKKVDRETMKKINNPTDVQMQELVAAYSYEHKDWLYAQVIVAPGCNFAGLACFVKDGSSSNNFAVDFKENVRKFLTKEEIVKLEEQKKSESSGCSLQ